MIFHLISSKSVPQACATHPSKVKTSNIVSVRSSNWGVSVSVTPLYTEIQQENVQNLKVEEISRKRAHEPFSNLLRCLFDKTKEKKKKQNKRGELSPAGIRPKKETKNKKKKRKKKQRGKKKKKNEKKKIKEN